MTSVLAVASEAYPLLKTGGLADVAAALPADQALYYRGSVAGISGAEPEKRFELMLVALSADQDPGAVYWIVSEQGRGGCQNAGGEGGGGIRRGVAGKRFCDGPERQRVLAAALAFSQVGRCIGVELPTQEQGLANLVAARHPAVAPPSVASALRRAIAWCSRLFTVPRGQSRISATSASLRPW